MPDPFQPEVRPVRSDADRSADHAAIDRLGAELLPSLIAKLGATGLGELEVREGAWRVRLRRPAADGQGSSGHAASSGRDRRPSDRAGERGGTDRGDRHPERTSRPTHHASDGTGSRSSSRSVATSPAVGIYHPRTDLAAGDRVRTGDRLGAVDMLGVAQEVLSPADGIVGATLVEPGDAVEYGQDLLVVEIVVPSVTSTNGTGG